ncbi:aldo/keto reductase [Terriglobus aquaticus]|uniref:Aldo/keto reductase n=1 Tax=Terriglobus aquaticus TaxID=940139 RepID=A0ABW9KI94_9BACT|nr:aldo/keto reductase [Terriglobus aquaticus]
MQTLALPGTGQQTTRLGFGCSGIAGGTDRRHSLLLLETAFDAGIRHFDCAPMYGFGTAEGVLGEFLQRHPGCVTVTTKFGLLPGRQHSPARIARSVARRASRVLGGSKSSQRFAEPLRKARFNGEAAARALATSLRQLRAEHINLYLLHEATSDDLRDESLLHFLQEQVRQGSIGAFGVGSARSELNALQSQQPHYCAVVQSEWCPGEPATVADGSFRITHRGLQGSWQDIYRRLVQSPRTLSAWSIAVGIDLAEQAVWPRLLLRACLAVNPSTLVLFSTRSPSHLLANVAAAQDSSLTRPATCLHRLLQSNRGDLLTIVDSRQATVSLASGRTP